MISFKGRGVIKKVLKVEGDFDIKLSAFDWCIDNLPNAKEITIELNSTLKDGIISMKSMAEISHDLDGVVSKYEDFPHSRFFLQKEGILDRIFR